MTYILNYKVDAQINEEGKFDTSTIDVDQAKAIALAFTLNITMLAKACKDEINETGMNDRIKITVETLNAILIAMGYTIENLGFPQTEEQKELNRTLCHDDE